MRTANNAIVLALVVVGVSACEQPPSPLGPSAAVGAPPTASATNTPASTGYVADVMLSGVVYEITATGLTPLAGATVYCDACGEFGHTWATTDSSGSYAFKGLWLTFNPIPLHVTKEGYDDPPGLPPLTGFVKPAGTGWREVKISGDTKFDMRLTRHGSALPGRMADGALFGVISAMSASGRLPLSGVELEVALCPKGGFGASSFVRVVTGPDGKYRVDGMCAGETYFWVSMPGYVAPVNPRQCDGGCLYVVIDGDTRVDLELVKQ